MQTIPKLNCGPMTKEIIETIFHFSHYRKLDIGIIPSFNQINRQGGYVHGWNTYQFIEHINELRKIYEHAKVYICRDHCGLYFGNINDFEELYKEIDTDIECGFDLIHIDLCKTKFNNDEKIFQTRHFMEYCLNKNPNIQFEVGTDENTGKQEEDIYRIENNIKEIIKTKKPLSYVVNTGSLVMNGKQVGNLKISQGLIDIFNIIKNYNIAIKEHNADYIDPGQIFLRTKYIDSFNIAPQLANVFNYWFLEEFRNLDLYNEYFYNPNTFTHFMDNMMLLIDLVYTNRCWKKWFTYSPMPKEAALIYLHYHTNSKEYQNLRELVSSTSIKYKLQYRLENVMSNYYVNK